MQSGTPFHQWAVAPPGWAKRRTEAISTIYGCPENSKEMVNCLKSLHAEELTMVYPKLFVSNMFLNCFIGYYSNFLRANLNDKKLTEYIFNTDRNYHTFYEIICG